MCETDTAGTVGNRSITDLDSQIRQWPVWPSTRHCPTDRLSVIPIAPTTPYRPTDSEQMRLILHGRAKIGQSNAGNRLPGWRDIFRND